MTSKYTILGLSALIVFALFLTFDWNNTSEYDYTGIVFDVKETNNGCTFSMSIYNGYTFKCFSREIPEDLGYYAIEGDTSSDGGIFFVSHMKCLDMGVLNNSSKIDAPLLRPWRLYERDVELVRIVMF